MARLTDRIRTDRYVTAMAAGDTIALIEQRVRNLLTHGRRISMTHRYVYADDAGFNTRTPELYTGLTQDGDVNTWSNGTGFGVNLRPGLRGFGVSAYASDGNATEAEAWKRYHATKHGDHWTRRRDMTVVTIEGGLDNDGPARDDSLTVQCWNQHGVCTEMVIGFDYDTGPGRLTRLRAELQEHVDNLDGKRTGDRNMLEYVLHVLARTADLRADDDAEVTALRDAAQAAKFNYGDMLPADRMVFVEWLNRRADRLEGKDV